MADIISREFPSHQNQIGLFYCIKNETIAISVSFYTKMNLPIIKRTIDRTSTMYFSTLWRYNSTFTIR